MSAAVAEPEALTASHTAAQRLWCTVVHDDPVNTMDYVTWVFHSYFSFPLPLARRRMLEVHTRGRAVVSRGARERMEVDVTAMHSYGLHATIEPLTDGGPRGSEAPGPAAGSDGGPAAGPDGGQG